MGIKAPEINKPEFRADVFLDITRERNGGYHVRAQHTASIANGDKRPGIFAKGEGRKYDLSAAIELAMARMWPDRFPDIPDEIKEDRP